jgi:hypothetical protein
MCVLKVAAELTRSCGNPCNLAIHAMPAIPAIPAGWKLLCEASRKEFQIIYDMLEVLMKATYTSS